MCKKRKCHICSRWFIPRTSRQYVCSRKKCQSQRQDRNNRNWRKKHLEYFKTYYSSSSELVLRYEKERRKKWFLKNPNYFKRYRQQNKNKYRTYMKEYMKKYRKDN